MNGILRLSLTLYLPIAQILINFKKYIEFVHEIALWTILQKG
jgi:hypothetical protein